MVDSSSVGVLASAKRAERSPSRGRETRPRPQWATHSPHTDGSRPGWPRAGQPLHRRGASSVPALRCAQFFFFNPLSFQKWHEAVQSPGQHLSFVCPPLTIYFLFPLVVAALQAVTPTMLLQVSAHSSLICSGKNSGWIKCPCGNSGWIVFIFYHLILTSQRSLPVRVSTGNWAIHQFKAWP